MNKKLRFLLGGFIFSYTLYILRVSYIFADREIPKYNKEHLQITTAPKISNSQKEDLVHFVKVSEFLYHVENPTWIEKNNRVLIGYPKSLSNKPIRYFTKKYFSDGTAGDKFSKSCERDFYN